MLLLDSDGSTECLLLKLFKRPQLTGNGIVELPRYINVTDTNFKFAQLGSPARGGWGSLPILLVIHVVGWLFLLPRSTHRINGRCW
jgi:hypothetical protein